MCLFCHLSLSLRSVVSFCVRGAFDLLSYATRFRDVVTSLYKWHVYMFLCDMCVYFVVLFCVVLRMHVFCCIALHCIALCCILLVMCLLFSVGFILLFVAFMLCSVKFHLLCHYVVFSNYHV